MIQGFWSWYKKYLHLNRTMVAVLFSWQLFHLFWLTTHVVADRLIGYPLFSPSDFYQFFLIFADYAEIPALISGTLLYLYALKRGSVKKNLFFILLINSQWLHLFWITDEFVVANFQGAHSYIPIWLGWLAIFIDYLELPVIYDTVKNTLNNFLKRN